MELKKTFSTNLKILHQGQTILQGEAKGMEAVLDALTGRLYELLKLLNLMQTYIR